MFTSVLLQVLQAAANSSQLIVRACLEENTCGIGETHFKGIDIDISCCQGSLCNNDPELTTPSSAGSSLERTAALYVLTLLSLSFSL